MSGGNRAFTLQDILGQLNQNANQSSTDDSALQINQLAMAAETVTAGDAVAVATAGTSFCWNDPNAVWGALPWGSSVTTVNGGGASSGTGNTWDAGGASPNYIDFSSLYGGNANG